MEAAVEASLLQAAQVVEQKLDDENRRLDEMDDDELERLREKRLAAMKKKQESRMEFIRMG